MANDVDRYHRMAGGLAGFAEALIVASEGGPQSAESEALAAILLRRFLTHLSEHLRDPDAGSSSINLGHLVRAAMMARRDHHRSDFGDLSDPRNEPFPVRRNLPSKGRSA